MRISLPSLTFVILGCTVALSACGPKTNDVPATVVTESSSSAQSEVTEQRIDADILLQSPTADAVLTSPLEVSGMAKGQWFFEGQLPVKLLDDQNNEIASGTAHAEGDWMSEGLVPFTATLEFMTDSANGFLVIQKDNPSGLPENANELKMPVKFK